jgi:hypothetical protein
MELQVLLPVDTLLVVVEEEEIGELVEVGVLEVEVLEETLPDQAPQREDFPEPQIPAVVVEDQMVSPPYQFRQMLE